MSQFPPQVLKIDKTFAELVKDDGLVQKPAPFKVELPPPPPYPATWANRTQSYQIGWEARVMDLPFIFGTKKLDIQWQQGWRDCKKAQEEQAKKA